MIEGAAIYEEVTPDLSVATGDLYTPLPEFGEPDAAGIVLTPMCDLAQGKAEWVKLAHAIPFRKFLEQNVIPQEFKGRNEYRALTADALLELAQTYAASSARRETKITLGLVKPLREIMKNVDPRRAACYFLPGKGAPTEGYLVSFSFVISVSFEKLRATSPLLRLKSPWREQLLGRYVTHSSRVGTPDYSDDYICSAIRAFFPELTEEQVLSKLR